MIFKIRSRERCLVDCQINAPPCKAFVYGPPKGDAGGHNGFCLPGDILDCSPKLAKAFEAGAASVSYNVEFFEEHHGKIKTIV
jgi:hypothetical protein